MPAPRPLFLYRFHTPDCQVHKIKNLAVRAKKFYRHCDCFIWITGMTAKGEFVPRQTTKLREWEAAEAYLASLNNQIAQEIQDGDGITIADARQQFLDGHKAFASGRVISQHKLTLDRFQTYANGQGVRRAAKITYDLCKNFQTYGFEDGIGDNTKSAYISKFKVFLGEAFTRRWITENISDRLKNTTQQYDAGEPYTGPRKIESVN